MGRVENCDASLGTKRLALQPRLSIRPILQALRVKQSWRRSKPQAVSPLCAKGSTGANGGCPNLGQVQKKRAAR